jgi:hypothetical protein
VIKEALLKTFRQLSDSSSLNSDLTSTVVPELVRQTPVPNILSGFGSFLLLFRWLVDIDDDLAGGLTVASRNPGCFQPLRNAVPAVAKLSESESHAVKVLGKSARPEALITGVRFAHKESISAKRRTVITTFGAMRRFDERQEAASTP